MTAQKIIIVAGFGPGISSAFVKKFGKQDNTLVAIIARTQSKLDTAVKELSEIGLKVVGHAADLSDPNALEPIIKKLRQQGQIHTLFWNPGGSLSGFDASTYRATQDFNIYVLTLLRTVQLLKEDLEMVNGQVLVTGGALELEADVFVQMAVQWNAIVATSAQAAKRKLVNLLHVELKPKGIYVGELTVCNAVKGTPFDVDGKSTLTPEAIANKFWEMSQQKNKWNDKIE